MRARWGRVFPHVPIAVLIAAYAWYFARLSVAVQDGYGTFGFDLGIFDQGVWLLSRFHAPFVTVMGRDLFGDHTSFVLLATVPLYWIHDAPQTLLVTQAILIAAAAVPIYLVAIRLTASALMATLLAGAYLLDPALQEGTLDQFHPEAFLVLSISVALLAAVTDRRRLLVAAVVLALLTKEDTAVLVVPLGVWVACRRSRRLGLAIVAGAAAYLAFAYEVVIAALLGTTTFYANRIPFGGLRGLLGEPLLHPRLFVDYVRGDGRPWYLWQLGSSFGWLALISPEMAAVALGSLAENTLSTFPYMHQIGYQYTLAIVPVLAVGTVWAVSRLATRRRRLAASFAVAASAWLCCVLWGLAPFSVTPTPYVYPPSTVRQINAVAAAIPPGAVISVYDSYVPHVDHRLRCYQWPTPFEAENWALNTDVGRPLPFAGSVDYLLLPTRLARADQAVLTPIRSQFRVVRADAAATLWRRSPPGQVASRRDDGGRAGVRAPRT